MASGSADETVRLWNPAADEAETEKESQDQTANKPPKKGKKHDKYAFLFSIKTPLAHMIHFHFFRAPKELLKTFKTKRTPVHTVKFTGKNLLLASGPFSTE